MFKHGLVDLSNQQYGCLIGRRGKDDFSEEARACELHRNEPVVLVSAPRVARLGQHFGITGLDSCLLPKSRRIKIWIPACGSAGWVWQSTTEGAVMIQWGVCGDPYHGVVDMSNVPFTTLVARTEEFTSSAKLCELLSGQHVYSRVPEARDRRIRVWAPRLNKLCWIWQADTLGMPLVRWFDTTVEESDSVSEPREEAIVQIGSNITEKVGLLGRIGNLLSIGERPPLFRQGEVVLRCSAGSPPRILPDGKCLVKVPGAETLNFVSEAEISDLMPSIEEFLVHHESYLPQQLIRELNTALDDYVGQADDAPEGSQRAALFGRAAQRRDAVWRDVLDPDLCLADPVGYRNALRDRRLPTFSADELLIQPRPLEWQTADIDIDATGSVKWASWLNHIDEDNHAKLLHGLAELLGVALPLFESICERSLRGHRLQVVVRATDQILEGEDQEFYRISEWHMDGSPEECILATAVCYLDVAEGLTGGTVEFAGNADAWLDDPTATHVVQPLTGSVLVFDNYALRHRVNMLRGSGLRRLIALHLVDPENPQRPAASELPRLWQEMQAWTVACALAPCKLPLGHRVIRKIASFASAGASAQDCLNMRIAERERRLSPGLSTGTGIFTGTGISTGTGTFTVEDSFSMRRTATGTRFIRQTTGIHRLPMRRTATGTRFMR